MGMALLIIMAMVSLMITILVFALAVFLADLRLMLVMRQRFPTLELLSLI